MYVIVNVTGGQGFLPDELKGNVELQQVFAQDIIDRYCSSEYFNPEVVEGSELPSLWYRMRLWFRVCPLFQQV